MRYVEGVKTNWRHNDCGPAVLVIGLIVSFIAVVINVIIVLFHGHWSWDAFALAAPFVGFGLFGVLGGGLIDMPPKTDKS